MYTKITKIILISSLLFSFGLTYLTIQNYKRTIKILNDHITLMEEFQKIASNVITDKANLYRIEDEVYVCLNQYQSDLIITALK